MKWLIVSLIRKILPYALMYLIWHIILKDKIFWTECWKAFSAFFV